MLKYSIFRNGNCDLCILLIYLYIKPWTAMKLLKDMKYVNYPTAARSDRISGTRFTLKLTVARSVNDVSHRIGLGWQSRRDASRLNSIMIRYTAPCVAARVYKRCLHYWRFFARLMNDSTHNESFTLCFLFFSPNSVNAQRVKRVSSCILHSSLSFPLLT